MKRYLVLWPFSLLLAGVLVYPDVRERFQAFQGEFLYIFSLSFLFCVILAPPVFFLSRKLDILDHPDPRKVHKEPTPLLGGVAICSAILLTLILNYDFSFGIRRIFVAGAVLLVVGVLDDCLGISARIRLLFQILASLFVIFKADTRLTFLPPGTAWDILEVILTVIWIVGITNAFNFFDGLDGLAAGIAMIASLAFLIVSFIQDSTAMGVISAAIAGSCFGFLVFNFHPAKIFMGDGGSTFLGFLLASIAVYGDWSSSHPIVSFGVPILILSPLIFDMIYITVDRIRRGDVKSVREWLEYTGRDHLHHRLQNIGLNTVETVLFIYLITSAVGIGALILPFLGLVGMLLILFQTTFIYLIVTGLMVLSAEHSYTGSYIKERIRRIKQKINTQKNIKSEELRDQLKSETSRMAEEFIREIEKGSF